MDNLGVKMNKDDASAWNPGAGGTAKAVGLYGWSRSGFKQDVWAIIWCAVLAVRRAVVRVCHWCPARRCCCRSCRW